MNYLTCRTFSAVFCKLNIKFNGLRTLTGWQSLEAMKVFRNSGHHLDAMRNVKKIGKAKSITWEAQSEPDWHEAREKLAGIAD